METEAKEESEVGRERGRGWGNKGDRYV